MDRIDLYRTFARVVETGSFTKAAATLDMPRSTVSTAIVALEERLGTRLLNRTTRVVRPTQDGLAFYDRCVRLIADVEEAEGAFAQSRNNPTGRLHVNMPGRIGRLIVAPALPGFVEAYPDIAIQLGVTDRAVDIIEDNVDCALRVGPLGDSGLIARQIGSLRFINVASPAYLERYGTPHRPDDLVARHGGAGSRGGGHQMVGYASPTSGRLDDWEWVEDGKVRTMPLCATVTVNSAEAYIACAIAGLGLIQIPAYDVADDIAAGKLVEVMPDHCAEPMPMNLLFPQRRYRARHVDTFIDWLVALLKDKLSLPA